jgi:FdhD protein
MQHVTTARRVVDRRTVVAVRDGSVTRRADALAGEEPMEIRVNGTPISVTMRTPGNDFELALGFCLTEGLIATPEAVRSIRYCVDTGDEAQEYNVVDVGLVDPTPVPDSLRRNVYTTSSCGLCGTASIDAVRKRVPDVSGDGLRLAPAVLAACGPPRGCSTGPAGCTRRGCSTPAASSFACARTWAGTTRSTR